MEGAEEQRMRERYREDGYAFHHGFVSRTECEEIVAKVEAHREKMIAVEIDSWIAKNRFFTINGEELEELVPAIRRMTGELCEIACQLEGRTLAPLDNKTVGLSLNLTPASGTLSWHYDRNLVTAVVHLNEVEGGEFEAYPRYRIRMRNNHERGRKLLQRFLDLGLRPELMRSAFGRKAVVAPTAGCVGFMDSTCLHQVAPVRGSIARGAIVLCFDEPGKVFTRDRTRNYYGYRDRLASLYR